MRYNLSNKWLTGIGIEIGALHNPLPYNKEKAQVKYLDRLSITKLRKQYPELNNYELVELDYIDNGETLDLIEDNSLDFIIANHFIEHCVNPIQTIQNHLKKIKKESILYYAIPDKRLSFDIDRELTSIDHLIEDYFKKNDSIEHYYEWSKYVSKLTNENDIEEEVKKNLEMNYSIHFHVWTSESFIEFIQFLTTANYFENNFHLETSVINDTELIIILKKD